MSLANKRFNLQVSEETPLTHDYVTRVVVGPNLIQLNALTVCTPLKRVVL